MNHLNIFHQIILLNHIRDEHFITEEIYAENMRQRETVENDLICKRQRTTHAMNCVVAEAFAMVGKAFEFRHVESIKTYRKSINDR